MQPRGRRTLLLSAVRAGFLNLQLYERGVMTRRNLIDLYLVRPEASSAEERVCALV